MGGMHKIDVEVPETITHLSTGLDMVLHGLVCAAGITLTLVNLRSYFLLVLANRHHDQLLDRSDSTPGGSPPEAQAVRQHARQQPQADADEGDDEEEESDGENETTGLIVSTELPACAFATATSSPPPPLLAVVGQRLRRHFAQHVHRVRSRRASASASDEWVSLSAAAHPPSVERKPPFRPTGPVITLWAAVKILHICNESGSLWSILEYMLANWLFFQIFLLVVLESLDALRTGFWLAGSVAKCSNVILVSIRWMSLLWGGQFVCMALLGLSYNFLSIRTWAFTCLPIVIFTASVSRVVCAVCAFMVQTEVVYRVRAVLKDLDPAMAKSLVFRVKCVFAFLCSSQVARAAVEMGAGVVIAHGYFGLTTPNVLGMLVYAPPRRVVPLTWALAGTLLECGSCLVVLGSKGVLLSTLTLGLLRRRRQQMAQEGVGDLTRDAHLGVDIRKLARAGPLLANDLEAVQSMVNRFYQEVSLSFEGTSDAVLAEHIVEHTVPVVGAVDHETMDDMSRPLAQYYVYTSHNTYLEGPQVFSRASGGAVEKALLAGCRVVELDCWESWGPKKSKRVIVTHGYAMTSACTFRDAVEDISIHQGNWNRLIPHLDAIQQSMILDDSWAVRAHAFTVSEYPVILTLENHCQLDLQAEMADLLSEVLGDIIAKPADYQLATVSPEQLIGKVLLVNEPKFQRKNEQDFGSWLGSDPVADGLRVIQATYYSQSPSSRDHLPAVSPSFVWIGHDVTEIMRRLCDGKSSVNIAENKDMLFGVPQNPLYCPAEEAPPCKLVVALTLHGCHSSQTFLQDEPIELGEEMLVHPKLLRLSFFTLKAFSAFDEPGQGPRNVSEKTAKLAALRDSAQFASSAQRRLYRVYPSGGRLGFEWWVAGHNLDPMYPWSAGCQLAAVNMQCHDRAYRLNTSRFRLNNRAGYVLKPELLQNGDLEQYQTLITQPKRVLASRGSFTVLYLHLLCGVNLHSSLCSDTSRLYCVMDVCSIRPDSKKSRTSMKLGPFPLWDEAFLFPIAVPEVAMVQIILLDAGINPQTGIVDRIMDITQDIMIGNAVLPLDRMHKGLCKIPLHSEHGEPLPHGEHLMAHVNIHTIGYDEELYDQLLHSKSMDYEMSHFLMDLMGLEPAKAKSKSLSRISSLVRVQSSSSRNFRYPQSAHYRSSPSRAGR